MFYFPVPPVFSFLVLIGYLGDFFQLVSYPMVLSMNILTLIYSPGFAHIVFPITGLKKETPHMDLALESETYIEAKFFCLDVVHLVSRSNTVEQ